MKAKTLSVVSLVLGMAMPVAADDLPSLVESAKASLDGRNLRAANASVAVARGLDGASRGKAALAALRGAGALKDAANGRKVVWSVEDHVGLDQVRLFRQPASAADGLTREQELDELRRTQGKVDKAAVVQRAGDVAKALGKACSADPAVEFRPISAALGVVMFKDANSDRSETVNLGYRVVYRRHLNGVPVLGRESEVEAYFDNAGELSEVACPKSELKAQVNGRATLAGKSDVTASFRSGKFSAVPSKVGETVKVEGRDAVVRDVQCGYHDDGQSSALKRACVVRYVSGGQSVEAVLPID